MKRIYNLKKQNPDDRDFKLLSVINPHSSVKLPASVDLRSSCPPMFDQGQLGSCTANAGIAAFMFLHKTQVMSSRLFQYYNERLMEGDVNSDGGAQMRDIGKALQKYGVCREISLPYDIVRFTEKPTEQDYKEALDFKVVSYVSIPDYLGIKNVLALQQNVVMIGIDIYSSFESPKVASTGVVPIPNVKKEQLLGGHAVCIVGYDDKKKRFIVRNSWGVSWGDKGYFYLPYTYFTKGYASDFWMLQK